MDLINVAQAVLTAIGGLSVVLGVIAPLTKNKTDDKILYWAKKILSIASLNVSEKTLGFKTDDLSVTIKKKKNK